MTPFKWLSDLQRSGMKFGHELNHLGFFIFFRGKITWIYPHTQEAIVTTRIFFRFLVGNPYKLPLATKFWSLSNGWRYGAWWFGWFLGSPKMKAGIFWILWGGIPIRILNHRSPKPHQFTITVVESLCCLAFFPNGFSHQQHTKPEEVECWFTVISGIVIYPAGNYITYPTLGKGKSSSKVPSFGGIC